MTPKTPFDTSLKRGSPEYREMQIRRNGELADLEVARIIEGLNRMREQKNAEKKAQEKPVIEGTHG